VNEARLEFLGTIKCNDLPSTFRLIFESAGPRSCGYSLLIHMSSAHMPREHDDYHAKSSASWLNLWCDGLEICQQTSWDDGPDHLYQTRVEQALNAEADLTETPAIQQAILNALRDGATFATSHKEGGSRIGFENGHFFKHDYGEIISSETFVSDTAFLAFLRRFYDWETSKSCHPHQAPEPSVWRLILRLLIPSRP